VAPAYDHAEITALAAATVAFEISAVLATTGCSAPERAILPGQRSAG
jgi:hypothetical protein